MLNKDLFFLSAKCHFQFITMGNIFVTGMIIGITGIAISSVSELRSVRSSLEVKKLRLEWNIHRDSILMMTFVAGLFIYVDNKYII
jgi:hypothetical protein